MTRHPGRPRPAAALGTGLSVATATMVGCAGTPPPTDAQGQQLRRNIDHWAMPLDSCTPSLADQVREGKAVGLIIEPCMNRAGHAYAVDLTPVTPSGVSMNAYGVKLFDASVAASIGYGTAGADQGAANPVQADPRLVAAGTRQLERCRATAQHRLPPLPSATADYSRGLADRAQDAALRSTTVVRAAAAWRTCLAPLGITDLPDSPLDMPSPGVNARRPHEEVAPTAGQRAYELEVAEHDADCRESSGFRRALYSRSWDEQSRLLRENEDTLQRVAARLAAHDRAVDRALAEAGS
jgi:hypothetical protein